MNDIQILTDELVKFRDERNWSQFHNTKDLALAISIEAAELNELFLWKTNEESESVDRNKLKEELADVFAISLLLAGKHGFDVKEIVLEKIKKNGEKYPVERSKGTAKKYNELQMMGYSSRTPGSANRIPENLCLSTRLLLKNSLMM